MAKTLTKWEYLAVNDFNQVGQLGLIGWELVAVSAATFRGPPVYYLKREVVA